MRKIFESSFEEPFYDWQNISELTIPHGWSLAWKQRVSGDPEGRFVRPEYDMKNKRLGHPEIKTGLQAAAVNATSSTILTALYRQFNVEPGPVVASVEAMIKSHEGAGSGMVMGIDPFGGTDLLGENITWGGYWSQYMYEYKNSDGWGKWHTLNCRTDAQGTVVTVFLKFVNDHPAQWAAGIWDDFGIWDTSVVEGNEQIVQDLQELARGVDEVMGTILGLIQKYGG